MDKHIIFSDVDGTVYAQDHIIHPQTIKDIKMAQDLGVEFAICTGNASLPGENMMQLATKLNARYIVGSNGASLYDMEKQEYIYTSVIPKATAQEILKFAMDNKMSANWWDKTGVWGAPDASDKLLATASHAILSDGKMMPRATEIKDDILKIEFYDDPSNVDKAQAFAESKGLQAARMKTFHVEVTHTGVSKGHGVKKLCDLLGVKLENTMGIGDSANDLGMFKEVGHSYAMDNASDEVKEAAMHYTSDVKQNGLGEAIVDYLHRTKLDRNNK